ncbi:hypothetical protein D3C81_1253310 [compost metagenome]
MLLAPNAATPSFNCTSSGSPPPKSAAASVRILSVKILEAASIAPAPITAERDVNEPTEWGVHSVSPRQIRILSRLNPVVVAAT